MASRFDRQTAPSIHQAFCLSTSILYHTRLQISVTSPTPSNASESCRHTCKDKRTSVPASECEPSFPLPRIRSNKALTERSTDDSTNTLSGTENGNDHACLGSRVSFLPQRLCSTGPSRTVATGEEAIEECEEEEQGLVDREGPEEKYGHHGANARYHDRGGYVVSVREETDEDGPDDCGGIGEGDC